MGHTLIPNEIKNSTFKSRTRATLHEWGEIKKHKRFVLCRPVCRYVNSSTKHHNLVALEEVNAIMNEHTASRRHSRRSGENDSGTARGIAVIPFESV